MLPDIFGENLFDEFFGEPFGIVPAFDGRYPNGKHAKSMMKTDVRETENGYELDMELPGFKKDEVHVDLKNGYLTVSAEKNTNSDDRKNGKYVRRERFYGQYSRSFYVGDGLEPKSVSARFEDGILKLTLPKVEQKKLPESTSIAIE